MTRIGDCTDWCTDRQWVMMLNAMVCIGSAGQVIMALIFLIRIFGVNDGDEDELYTCWVALCVIGCMQFWISVFGIVAAQKVRRETRRYAFVLTTSAYNTGVSAWLGVHRFVSGVLFHDARPPRALFSVHRLELRIPVGEEHLLRAWICMCHSSIISHRLLWWVLRSFGRGCGTGGRPTG